MCWCALWRQSWSTLVISYYTESARRHTSFSFLCCIVTVYCIHMWIAHLIDSFFQIVQVLTCWPLNRKVQFSFPWFSPSHTKLGSSRIPSSTQVILSFPLQRYTQNPKFTASPVPQLGSWLEKWWPIRIIRIILFSFRTAPFCGSRILSRNPLTEIFTSLRGP